MTAPTTTPTTPGTPAAEPLPSIAAVSPKTAYKLTRTPYVSDQNRLSEIRLAGKELESNITEAVTRVGMSFSAQQVGQLDLTILDTPDGELLNSGLLDRGTPLDFGDQHMDIRTVEVSTAAGGVQLVVKARSRLISDLKGQTGKGTWGEQDVSKWYADRAREVGAADTIIQPDLGKLAITRQESTQVESTWDVMARTATKVGVWCFEYEQTLVVGKPTWLAARQGNRVWEMHWAGYSDYTQGYVGGPKYTGSEDSEDRLTVQILSEDAWLARPGHIFALGGRLKPANGVWLITAVNPPVANTGATTLDCVRPVDPIPPTSA